MVPENCLRTDIARALWDESSQQNFHKTEYFIEVTFHGNTKVNYCRPSVFLVPICSRAEQRITRHGQVKYMGAIEKEN